MKQKYFKADNAEAALVIAGEYFGTASDELEVVRVTELAVGDGTRDPGSEQAEDGEPSIDETPRILALISEIDRSQTAVDAAFRLSYESDGVYLEVYPPRSGGASLHSEYLTSYAERKKLSGEVEGTLARALRNSDFARELIAPPQTENILNEELRVSVSPDKLSADMRLLPPDETGSRFDRSSLLSELDKNGVRSGISDDMPDTILAKREYHRDYRIANGKPAVDGVEASVEFLFRRELTGTPFDLGDSRGRVDFRKLDIIEPVKRDQLLVRRTPPTLGEPGFTVDGSVLPAKPGRDYALPKSKNCYANEAGTELYADCSGKVEFNSNTVIVSDTYQISGDCDMGIGHIDFDGNVNISGNVINGMSVKATGDITVGGYVESSKIESEGSVEVKQGIQGMNRGETFAGGDIKTPYIERAVAVAGGNINTDVVMHSDVSAGDSLIVTGRRGNILGGTARATNSVTVNNLGSISHAQTEVDVGLAPEKRQLIAKLQRELENLGEEFDKIQKLTQYLAKPTTSDIDAGKRKLLRDSAIKSAQRLTQLYREYTEELDRLKSEEEAATGGKVHVLGTVFPGVRIKIASAMFRVVDEMDNVSFAFSQGEIVSGRCEIKRA